MSTCQTSDEHNTSPRGFPARQRLVEGERAIRLEPIKRTIVDGNVDSYGARISISTWALASTLKSFRFLVTISSNRARTNGRCVSRVYKSSGSTLHCAKEHWL